MRKHIYRRNRLTESKIRGRRLTEGTRIFGEIDSGDMPSITFECFDWFEDDMYDECYEEFVKGKSQSKLDELEDKYGSIQDSPEYGRFEKDFTTEYMNRLFADIVLFEDTQRDVERIVDEANDDIRYEFRNWVAKHYGDDYVVDFRPYLTVPKRFSGVYTSGDFSPIVIDYGYYKGALLTALGEKIDEYGDSATSAELSRIVEKHLNAIISELA